MTTIETRAITSLRSAFLIAVILKPLARCGRARLGPGAQKPRGRPESALLSRSPLDWRSRQSTPQADSLRKCQVSDFI
jgi:hypothetical protein